MEMTTAIVLAAGQGTRMKSALPKVMHRVCGLPIVHFGVKAAIEAGCGDVVVVVGHGRELVEEYLRHAFQGGRVRTALQKEQRGTGDAARAGLAAIGTGTSAPSRVIVMNGDVPLVRGDDLCAVAAAIDHEQAGLAFATCVVDDPTGYGRVMREAGEVVSIREHRDLKTDGERVIREINAGIYAASLSFFRNALSTLESDNAQGELYVTDVVAFARRAAERIAAVTLGADVLAGVNDRDQLAEVERTMHGRLVRAWRIAGSTIRDGACLDASVELEPDTTIEGGAVLRGVTRVERGARVDAGCVLTNVIVGAEANVKPYTVATDSRIGPGAQVGPFAHLRPASDLGQGVHVGNFVETKNTRLARGSKANHLSYLGDGVIGEGANIGAGTIFCNYDGVSKHTTTVEAGAFIGSDSQLVAPVTVGANAYVATGTTVTRDVPAEALAVGRARQENKAGYAPKLRARQRAAKEAASPRK